MNLQSLKDLPRIFCSRCHHDLCPHGSGGKDRSDVGELENKLIGYADDPTLKAVVPSPGVRVTVAESLNRDLVRVNAWCDLRGMKLNASKTKTMIDSRSRTMHPQPPPINH